MVFKMIGRKIRDRRKELNMSLRELGRRAGLTASFISQLERGLINPSILSLRKISNVLGVPIFHLLTDIEEDSQVIKHNDRKKILFPQSNVCYELLSPDLHRKMVALIIKLKPGRKIVASRLAKQTEEIMYVMQGNMKIKIEDKEYSLKEGDSISYNGFSLREFSSSGKEELIVLCAMTPPIF